MQSSKSYNSFFIFIFLVICFFSPSIKAQEELSDKNNPSVKIKDESEVKAVVEHFLETLGNYELDKVRELMLPNANIAYFSASDEGSEIHTISADEFLSQMESRQNRKFQEPVTYYTVNISQGKLAFVRADATVHYDGKASHHTDDFFILMKDNDVWKILSGSYTTHPLEE